MFVACWDVRIVVVLHAFATDAVAVAAANFYVDSVPVEAATDHRPSSIQKSFGPGFGHGSFGNFRSIIDNLLHNYVAELRKLVLVWLIHRIHFKHLSH